MTKFLEYLIQPLDLPETKKDQMNDVYVEYLKKLAEDKRYKIDYPQDPKQAAKETWLRVQVDFLTLFKQKQAEKIAEQKTEKRVRRKIY